MSKIDKIGTALSVGCAVHCILMPIVLPLLPMLGFLVGHDSYFHLILAAIITGVAAIALIPGYLKHRFILPLASASLGIIIVIGMGVLEHITHSPLIILVTIFGSGLIINGHYFNHKYSCKCEHHKCH